MKIGINLRTLNPGTIGGMEVYVRNLLKHLLARYRDLEYLLFVTEENDSTLHFPANRVEKIRISHSDFGQRIVQEIIKKDVDIYFCPLLVLEPVITHIPTIITIPDMQHEIYPEFFDDRILEWRRDNFSPSATMASAVLTLSLFSADSISEKLGVSPKKVFPIHLSADESYGKTYDKETEAAIKQKYALPDIYGYFPANTWPHKNHKTLLEALRIYKQNYGAAPTIVLTGARDSDERDLFRIINEKDLEEDVLFLGYIPKDDMQYIYRNATFLVFPSLFEGFGMPVLEAMISECPVLCSNTTSLPEVAGDAALYFDPWNARELAEAIKKIMDDPQLRRRLISAGRVQARKFSWERTADETFQVIQNLLLPAKSYNVGDPLVSVVTPSFNQGEFIEETILSVLKQDYSNIEYVVMDGGSRDRTVDILKKYETRLQWVSEKDRGQADAINKGFRVAKGEILAWLNSDDLYLRGSVRRVVDYFNNNPDVVMVYGNAYYVDRDGLISGSYATENFRLQRLAEVCFICQPTVFVRVEALKEVGELNANLSTGLDYDLWIRIAKKFEGRIGYITDFLAISRMYEENKTLSMREAVYDEIISIVRKYFGYVPDTWAHGYIVDVINGIHMKRHDRLKYPLRMLINGYYIARFLLHVRNRRLISAVFRKMMTSRQDREALSFRSRFKGLRRS